MVDFFVEGGWAMYPVLVIGLILVGSAGRYAIDREPVRLRFIQMLSLTLLAFTATGVVADMSKVFWFLSREDTPAHLFARILCEGTKESLRPAVLGLFLLGVALIFVSIGVYRVGRRELDAARG